MQLDRSITLMELRSFLSQRANELGAPDQSKTLWPEEYSQPHARSAWRFICQLRTWNEAESETQPFPHKAYLRRIVREWVRCYRKGRPLIIEKSRRLVTSWVLRALELWVMGLKRSEGVIVHRTYPDASEHVWRIYHLYEDLRMRVDWDLQPASSYGSALDKKLDSVILPNGSKCECHFEKPEGLQGSGYAFVTCEEIAIYRRPSAIWAQAKFVTQSSANSVNGLVVCVTNASSNADWHEIKYGRNQR